MIDYKNHKSKTPNVYLEVISATVIFTGFAALAWLVMGIF